MHYQGEADVTDLRMQSIMCVINLREKLTVKTKAYDCYT